jgi:class 3 adenylate cyclase/ketosteroid isomerase-like protein
MSARRVRPGQLARSDELRAVIERLWAAWVHGDAEAVVQRFSRQAGVSGFGTDPSERFHDAAQIERYTRAEFAAVAGDWPFGPAEIAAWTDGAVGWATVESEVVAQPVESQPLRCTFVLHLERDEWKVVHQHWSIGVPNEHSLGLSLPLEVLAGVVGEEQPDLSATAAVDGTVTIVFTDIEDSTRLNAALGDRHWLEVLRAHNAIVVGATQRHGGMVVKAQGDGFMLGFSSARRALACARAIEQEVGAAFDDPGSPISVRIGVHVGEVIHEAEDFFGHAVNYAARVTAAARGGETLVSALVHGLVATTGEFDFDAPREVELKGIEGLQRVYPLALS